MGSQAEYGMYKQAQRIADLEAQLLRSRILLWLQREEAQRWNLD
jgi:hypothetical protein